MPEEYLAFDKLIGEYVETEYDAEAIKELKYVFNCNTICKRNCLSSMFINIKKDNVKYTRKLCELAFKK